MAILQAAAAQQFDVVHRVQLAERHIDRSWVHRKVAAGELTPLFPRTWLIRSPHADPAPDSICMAAVLYAGPGAAVSHVTTAERSGAWRRGGRAAYHVVTPNDRRGFRNLPVTFHIARQLPARDVMVIAGLPTTTVTRTVLDLGTVLTEHQLASVLGELAFQRRLDLEGVRERLDRAPGVPGSGVVRRALDLHLAGSAGTRSHSEDVYLDALHRIAAPRPVVNTRGTIPGFEHEPDFVWHDVRLVVEIDGPGHDKPGQREFDRALDARLRAAGWTPLRFDAREVRRDPEAAARRTLAVLDHLRSMGGRRA